jgi:hypothetical protein
MPPVAFRHFALLGHKLNHNARVVEPRRMIATSAAVSPSTPARTYAPQFSTATYDIGYILSNYLAPYQQLFGPRPQMQPSRRQRPNHRHSYNPA